jgi:hypothetical protein
MAKGEAPGGTGTGAWAEAKDGTSEAALAVAGFLRDQGTDEPTALAAAQEVGGLVRWYLDQREIVDSSPGTPAADAALQLSAFAEKLRSLEIDVFNLSTQARHALYRESEQDSELQFATSIAGFATAVESAAVGQLKGAPSLKKGTRPRKRARSILLVQLAAIWREATGLAASFSRRDDYKDYSIEQLEHIPREDYEAGLEGTSGPFVEFLRLVTGSLPDFYELSDRGLEGAFRRAIRNTNLSR